MWRSFAENEILQVRLRAQNEEIELPLRVSMNRFLLGRKALDEIGGLRWTQVSLQTLRHAGRARSPAFSLGRHMVQGSRDSASVKPYGARRWPKSSSSTRWALSC